MRQKIKNILVASIIGIFAPLLANSVEIVTAKSTITKVELFQNGAQVYKEVNYVAKTQIHTILIKNIPANIDPSTIRAKGLSEQKIVSLSFETDYERTLEARAEGKGLRDSLEQISLEIALKNSELASIRVQEDLLARNMDVLDNKHGSDELEKILALNARERSKLKKRIVEISHEIKKLRVDMTNLQRAYDRNGNVDRPLAGVVRLEVAAKPGVKQQLELSYMVPDAWWMPVYDARVSNIFEPLELEYRAEVFQNSFEDWDDVDLHFFNNNPYLKGALQDLRTWKVSYGSRPPSYALEDIESLPPSRISGNNGIIKGTIQDRDGESLPFANVIVKQNGDVVSATQSDFDGQFEIRQVKPGFYNVEISSLGFTSHFISGVRVSPAQTTVYACQLDQEALMLDVVEVISYDKPLFDKASSRQETITAQELHRMPSRNISALAATAGGTYSKDSFRGSRANANFYYIDGVKVRGPGAIAFADTRDEMRMEFQAPGKQSVPSSDKIKLVYLKSEPVEAHYVFKSIPKIEPTVYLYAEIEDWESLGLLSGKVNLFYDNTFVGESFIDANSTSDTLSVSLGLDHDIKVERERMQDEQHVPSFGANSVSIGWTIRVKNNKSYPVNIELHDQIPVSNAQSVDVKLEASDGAKFAKKSGELTWNFELNDKESKASSFRYEVKYPKGMPLTME